MTQLDFFLKINEFARENNMMCRLEPFGLTASSGDWSICVDFSFSDDLYICSRTLYYHIKERGNGMVNYWHEEIHDCKHHITGPGYGHCITTQTPVKLSSLCDRFLKELKHEATYYQPIKR